MNLRILPGVAGAPDREDLERERAELVGRLAPALERLYLFLEEPEDTGHELRDDDRLALIRQVERETSDLAALRRALASLPDPTTDEDAAQEARHEERFYATDPEERTS